MAEQQAKFPQINVDINQSLSINIQYNMFILHEINHKREKFTLKTSTPTCPTPKRLHLKSEQKSRAKFVKVFAKPLPSKEQNFPHFPLLVKGGFYT
ncbi:MAG: hypothetical protein LBJ95_02025 [Oscillospiraceae bacterium]|nr:hypothetical protein [Oscillospiraceae bacterium]